MKEAEAFAAGLPYAGARLHAAAELYPRTVWADWLCDEPRRVRGPGSPRTAQSWERVLWAR